MIVVGLTGGIGAGKSTVLAMFRALGAAVLDADELAREVVRPGTQSLREIHAAFGDSVLMDDGSLDRRALGDLVFNEKAARATLNGIIHPRLAGLARIRIEEARNQGAQVLVYDVPLLYENGLADQFDRVVVVTVDLDTQRRRIAARDRLEPSDIEARLAAQMPLGEKVSRADFVINNQGPVDNTRAEVARVWQALAEIGPGRARDGDDESVEASTRSTVAGDGEPNR